MALYEIMTKADEKMNFVCLRQKVKSATDALCYQSEF